LYSEKYYPLLQALRNGKALDKIFNEVNEFVKGKSINGFEAEKENQNFGMSMAKMGG
jgi:hypothetical protein